MKMSYSEPVRRCFVLPFLVSLAFLTVGCAGGSTNLTVTSLKDHQTYQQRFSKAYAGRSENGDFDVVLVNEEGQNADGPGVRQVMHVRVLWKPMKGAKLDHPTATNATIDWYVFGDTAGNGDGQPASGGMVAYTGAAFVNVEKSGGVARLDVRNATLRPTTRQGGLTDPIGRAKMQGTIVARTGRREEVRDLLAEAEQASAHVSAAKTEAARQASSRAPVEP
jgi:hypothetical protein